MNTIVLHGSLGREVGRERWTLNVQTLGEGLRAIEALTGKLFSKLLANDALGIQYQVNHGERPLETEDEFRLTLPAEMEVHVIPIVQGEANKGRSIGKLVIGVALVVLSVAVPGLGTIAGMAVSSIAFTLGLSLAMGGIMALISSQASKDEAKDKSSSSISGAINTARQGLAVPLAYGEIMAGSHTVSMSVSARNVALYG
jgi:predicted phage tail protein